MTASTTAALELEGLERAFRVGLARRTKPALRGVDLVLERGATLALVGPNGSGKSTLLRIVAGIDLPTRGRLRVLGGDPTRARVRAALAYLPENSPFPPELSASATMDLLGSLHGMPRRERRARAAQLLAEVGLEEHARTPLRAYSRGMKRRFGQAQAFQHEPELVLLDEPTAGLDAPGFAVIEQLLARARARGATVVLASHLLTDVHAHADRMLLLIAGRACGSGSPAELLGVEGRTRLEVSGLDAERLLELRAWVDAHGGRIESLEPAGRSLLELYRAEGGASLAARGPRARAEGRP